VTRVGFVLGPRSPAAVIRLTAYIQTVDNVTSVVRPAPPVIPPQCAGEVVANFKSEQNDNSAFLVFAVHPRLLYALYALLVNVFAAYVFVDYYLHVVLDGCAERENVENHRYFDHIVGKYFATFFKKKKVFVHDSIVGGWKYYGAFWKFGFSRKRFIRSHPPLDLQLAVRHHSR